MKKFKRLQVAHGFNLHGPRVSLLLHHVHLIFHFLVNSIPFLTLALCWLHRGAEKYGTDTSVGAKSPEGSPRFHKVVKRAAQSPNLISHS
jgi:hypothetical protein